MPSQLHESHLLLFRNQPELAAQLIRDALGVRLPPFREAQIQSADLTDVQPAEYRADLVVRLSNDRSVYAIVVEVQLAPHKDKPFTWPAYLANLRARLRCPVVLLVVTADEATARWAGRRIEMGGIHHLVPYVLGPSQIPEVADEAVARSNPELAVLSAMAHGREANPERAIEIALIAQKVSLGLDADRSKIYFDLILNSLGEAARRALNQMDARKYEYQSDFARRYVAEGEANGRAALILRQLAVRFGLVEADVETRIHAASIAELEHIGERLLVARTLDEAIGLQP